MFKKGHTIESAAMGRRLFVWQYGDFGPPLLVFPSAAGMAHEWENHSMTEALGDLIRRGRLKLYCAESNVSEAWTRKDSDPKWRIGRHRAYERFVLDDLLPFIRADCRTPEIPVHLAGCSLGATYAALFALKFPEAFPYALCMSGRYDVREFNPLDDPDVYFNNPMAFVPGLEGEALERVRRRTHLALVCGRGKWEDGNHQETAAFAELLRAKGIPHECDLWGFDVAHEWEWWRKQAAHHLARRFGG